jgi:mannitol-1-/sugar-/sorbitol-6-phosphatase
VALTWDDAASRLARPGAGLLLDLDGTLVDSEPVHRAAYRAYFASRGWQVADDVVAQFAGRRAAEVFAGLAGPWGDEDPEALTSGVLDELGGPPAEPVPVPGAADLLAACTRSRLPVAVVTSARRSWAEQVMRGLGADPGTLALVTAEDCTHGKPDPEPFRHGVDRLGLDPRGLVAAEDTPAGIASALGAGVGRVVGMSTSQPADRLLAAGAHETAPDLAALARAVEALQG